MAGLQSLRLLGVNNVANHRSASCVAVGRRSGFCNFGCRNWLTGSGDLGLKGLRLVVVRKEGAVGGGNCDRPRCGVVRNALAVDTNTSTTENSSAWKKFCTTLRNANQTLQNVVNINYWVVRDYDKLVHAVNSVEGYTRGLSDIELREKTTEFKERLKKGELLALSFPVVYQV